MRFLSKRRRIQKSQSCPTGIDRNQVGGIGSIGVVEKTRARPSRPSSANASKTPASWSGHGKFAATPLIRIRLDDEMGESCGWLNANRRFAEKRSNRPTPRAP